MKTGPIKVILALATAYFITKWGQVTLKETILSIIGMILSYMTFTYFKHNKAKLYFANTEKNNAIINDCPTIKAKHYQPPFLFQSSFVQLLGCEYLLDLSKGLSFRKEKVLDPNHKIVGMSLSWVEDLNKRPIKHEDVLVFVLPGLTGGEEDIYIHQLVDHICEKGFYSVVYNYRLLSQDLCFKNSKDFVNLISDLRMTFEFIKETKPQFKHIIAIGHSYGANQIVNYLGQYNSDPIIQAGVSIANPYCISISSKYIMGTIYDKFLAKLLGKKLKKVRDSFAEAPKEWGLDIDKAINAKTVYEFDSAMTIKFYGYPTVGDYYRKFGSINQILNVKVPLFCLSANDDDIANEKALPRDESSANKNIILMETDKGSHVVWLEGNNPLKMKLWFPKPTLEFIECIVKDLKK